MQTSPMPGSDSPHSLRPVIKIPSIDDILESPLPPVNWLLPRFIAAGDIAILGGPSYSGKSWILADLAVCWASGRPALSWAPEFERQRVLWIDEEQHKAEAWNRVRRIVRGRRIQKADLSDTLVYPEPRQGLSFKNRAAFSALVKLVEDFDPHWIFFDSLISISRANNENDSTQLRAFYHECLQPLNANGRRGILLLHHNRKVNLNSPTPHDPGDKENLRGSGDIGASPDAICMIWRTGNTTFIHSDKARSDEKHCSEPPWDLQLNLVEAHGGVYPKVISQRPPNGTTAATLDQLVLEVITHSSVPLTKEAIEQALSDQHGFVPSPAAVYRALKSLSRTSKIAGARAGRTISWTLTERS